MSVSTSELKTNIIEALKLQDITADQIDDEAPLFGTGLGGSGLLGMSDVTEVVPCCG